MAPKKKSAATDQPASPSGLPSFRGAPATTYGYTLPDGSAREIKSSAAGVVTPQRVEDVRFLDSFGLARADALKGMKKPALVAKAESMGLSSEGTADEIRERIESSSAGAIAAPDASPKSGGVSIETDAEIAKAAAEDAEKETE